MQRMQGVRVAFRFKPTTNPSLHSTAEPCLPLRIVEVVRPLRVVVQVRARPISLELLHLMIQALRPALVQAAQQARRV